ncbi:LysE family translocator [Albidovulum sp.]|uniref:LysE family translocator n=1 Tax=Albidovulum sp. TaxID=1872424 RepID=UPI0039B88025
MSPEFLLTSFLIIASPGTGALYTIGAGLARGPRGGLLAAFASTLGIVPHMLAAITGLAALLHASAMLYEALRLAGVVYLIWMAWQTWRDAGPLRLAPAATVPTARQVVAAAVAMNLLNPKLSIFFLAFLPQFVGTGADHPLAEMLRLSLVFMAMTLAVFAVYGLLAARFRAQVLSRPALVAALRRLFAAGFAALGLRLALSRP